MVGKTCNLQELDGHDVVFVARFPGRHLVNIDIVVGSRLPAFFNASGTAILAGLLEREQRAVLAQTRLQRLTPFTTVDPDALLRRVQETARRGYAVVTNKMVLGDIAGAAAIQDEHGLPVAAINISVPTTRWTVDRAEAELVQHVQAAAASISRSRFQRD